MLYFILAGVGIIYLIVTASKNNHMPAKKKSVKVIKGYKGFEKGLKCRSFQYEEGKEYKKESDPELCSTGFHFCENPLDVLGFYPLRDGNEFTEVEALGKVESDGSKSVTNHIRIGAKLDLKAFIDASVAFIFEKATKVSKKNSATSGDDAHSATRRKPRQLGYRAETAPTRLRAEPTPTRLRAETTPTRLRAETTPTRLRAEPTPTRLRAETTPTRLRAETAPTRLRAEPTPTRLRAETAPTRLRADTAPTRLRAEPTPTRLRAETAPTRLRADTAPTRLTSGDDAHSATSGDDAHSATSGDDAHSATSGTYAHSATSGNRANSATSGYGAHSATSGDDAIAVAVGRKAKAKASKGCFLVLAEWKEGEAFTDAKPLRVKSVKVDGKKVKADQWYKLVDGKLVETDDSNE